MLHTFYTNGGQNATHPSALCTSSSRNTLSPIGSELLPHT